MEKSNKAPDFWNWWTWRYAYRCTKQVFIRIKRTKFYTHIASQNKFQTRKFVEMVKYWELTTSCVKWRNRLFYQERPGRVFQTGSLVLNESKISKSKRRGWAFESHGWVFKHAAECLDSIRLNSCLRLKAKQNVPICHGHCDYCIFI